MLVSNRAPAQGKTIQRSLKKRNNDSEGAMTKYYKSMRKHYEQKLQ